MVILNLSRYGDCINLLPAIYGISQRLGKPTVVVSQEFADVFSGITYCDVKRYNQGPINLPAAIDLCRSVIPDNDLRVCQVFSHPDQQRLMPNFCMESYRLGGIFDYWRKFPTVFDNRNPEREAKLVADIPKPYIAFALSGVSSPFEGKEELLNAAKINFPSHHILDLCSVRAEFIVDLLGVLDNADCLVTIDTAHLWLANAAQCPVVCLLNNSPDPWRASTPPVTSIASFGYKDYNVDQVLDCVANCIKPAGDIILVADLFGKTKRHKKAQASWRGKFDLAFHSCDRDARDIGDPRSLPMLKSMLDKALRYGKAGDIIIWTNDDVEILDLSPIISHTRKFGACSVRRDPTHIGREMVAFEWQWLANRFNQFPDVAIAAPWFDLAIAAWIRKQATIISDLDNLAIDFFPCEIPNNGIFHHENHPSHWVGEKESFPAAKWNEQIYKSLV